MRTIEAQELRNSLLQRTGIDIGSYSNLELAERLSSLVAFPAYVFRKALLPPLSFFLIVLLLSVCLVIIGKGWGTVVLFFIFGSILGIANGIILGIMNFLKGLLDDVGGVLILSLEGAQKAIYDIHNASLVTTNRSIQRPTASEVVLAFVYIVVLPALTHTAKNRIPLIGTLVSKLIHKIFDLALPRVIEIVDKEKAQTLGDASANTGSTSEREAADFTEFSERDPTPIEKLKEKLNSILLAVRAKLIRPIKIVLIISSSFSIIVLAMIALL